MSDQVVETQYARPQLFTGDPWEGMPRFDSRFSRAYATDIMRAGGYHAELYKEMRQDGSRADAGLSVAFARSLEYIIRKPYEAEYPQLRAKEFIPLLTEVPPGANTYTYRMFDKTGRAAIISDSGNDAPKADVNGKEFQAPIVTVGMSYAYTIIDSMRAAMANIPLEAFKANACRFAIEFFIENLAAVGNAATGVVGLVNAPNINQVTQVSTGGNWITQINNIGSAAKTDATTPATVVAQAIGSDVNAMISAIYDASLGIHSPTNMLVPTTIYNRLRTTPVRPQYSNDTLLSYLEELTGLEIDPWPSLNSAGTSSFVVAGKTYQGAVVVYQKDPDILNLVVSQPFTQLPPQPRAMAWEVLAYARTGGVTVRRPVAISVMNGVC